MSSSSPFCEAPIICELPESDVDVIRLATSCLNRGDLLLECPGEKKTSSSSFTWEVGTVSFELDEDPLDRFRNAEAGEVGILNIRRGDGTPVGGLRGGLPPVSKRAGN